MYYFGLEDNFFKLKRKLNFNNNLKIKSKVFVNELILVNNFKLKNIFTPFKFPIFVIIYRFNSKLSLPFMRIISKD